MVIQEQSPLVSHKHAPNNYETEKDSISTYQYFLIRGESNICEEALIISDFAPVLIRPISQLVDENLKPKLGCNLSTVFALFE